MGVSGKKEKVEDEMEQREVVEGEGKGRRRKVGMKC